MANKNGLLCPQATHGNPDVSYYLRKGEAIIQPTFVAPVALKSNDLAANAQIAVTGFTAGAPTPNTGAITLNPGTSSEGAAPAGITVRAIDDGCAVDIGTNSAAENHLYIAGPDGEGEVYDEVYNPVIKPVPVATFTGAIPANTGPGLWTYTPVQSGAYMLQVNFNVGNADSIPINGAIEWVLNVGGGEVQYCSNTLKSTSISKASDFNEVDGVPGVLAPPMDYSFSNMAILTAGQQVSFYLSAARNSAAGGGAWSIANYQVRLVRMC